MNLTNAMVTLAASNPVDHVVNQLKASFDLNGMTIWWWSAHVGNLILAGLLTYLLITYTAKRVATGPQSEGTDRYVTKGSLAHMIEVICVYLRENTVRPLLHGRTDRFMPFLWTIFFFILINNLLGLVPFTDVTHLVDHFAGGHYLTGLLGATATQNIFVTAALALIAAAVINLAGIRELGVGGYVKHLTAGTPAYLWPLMVPIEIVGTVIKPVALCLRLFANMTAGHILVAVLLMFAVNGLGLLQKGGAGVALGPAISLVSIVSAVAIYFLELFVAFLQAFVFMFLTTVFISQLSHHHDHEHDEGHDHEHAHGHTAHA
jgi:F-type H+-transporting ATPase subunit a